MPLFPNNRRIQREAVGHYRRRSRIGRFGGTYIEDFVLGANDGIITTFAVVAAVTGGALSSAIILILGFANLLADAVSMGASSYLSRRAGREYIRSQRRAEEWEVDHLPEEEKEEVRRIFEDRGIKGGELDCVVDAITGNRDAWTDVMMALELGLAESGASPVKHGLATFTAFVVAGLAPLFPYLFCRGVYCFVIASIAAGVTLFIAGALRTLTTGVNWLRGALEMLAVGSVAAVVAYGVGRLVAAIT